MTTIDKVTEAQLQGEIDQLAGQVDLIVIAKKLAIGNFEIDGVAWDKSSRGGLVIIELKVNMDKALLAQVLLYQRALKMALPPSLADVPIRCLLISTYFDRGVIELCGSVKGIVDVELQLVKLDANYHFRLEPPTDADTSQVWDQAEIKESQIRQFDAFINELSKRRMM